MATADWNRIATGGLAAVATLLAAGCFGFLYAISADVARLDERTTRLAESISTASVERADIAAALGQKIDDLSRSLQAGQVNAKQILAAFGIIPDSMLAIETLVIGSGVYMFPYGDPQRRLLEDYGFVAAQIPETTLMGYRVAPIEAVLPRQ